MHREYDLVLLGATGFTGRLVAEYLLERGLDGARLALAGRSGAKLEQLRTDLARSHKAASQVPVLVADSHSRADMERVARAARVVCTTVGPYALHGAELVRACAENGTHYCDLVGEPSFVAEMIARHHERAVNTGARIVTSCGFDSIPSDLGVWMLFDAFSQRSGRLQRARLFMGESRGGFSGGTAASALSSIEAATGDPRVRRVLGNPYALYPVGEPPGLDGRDQREVRFEPDLGMWTAPFVMAVVNTRVVRRSNALLGFAYGRDFRYSEVMSTGKGAKGLSRAVAVTAGTAAVTAALIYPPTRRLIAKRLPQPGEGPSADVRSRGYFVARLIGDGTDGSGRPLRLRGRVRGDGDPGYGATRVMLAESALCLLQDELDCEGGIRTPASTMAAPLLRRLRAAGMTFEVSEA